MDVEVESQRHPIRFVVKLLVFMGLIYAAGRFIAQQKSQWEGLTESQAKAKVEAKLSSKVGEEKASEIANQVIAALTERGVIKPDEAPVAEAVEEVEEVAEKVEDEAE